jgi:hypothetical protein
MDFENLPEKKEYFAQQLARFSKNLAHFFDNFFITPYFIFKNKDLHHFFPT